jgi:hypothetical protein
VNYLSFIAESGVFDRANGLNSIENAKRAKLWDVLIYSSEKKSYEEAQEAFYKRKYKTS